MVELSIRGVGYWSAGVTDWSQASALIRSGSAWPDASGGRAMPGLMPANERRRAPDSVLMALAVGEQACAAAGVEPASLPSVFVSVYGDLAINDYMCAALTDPAPMLSPTKFHNSVHNAPSGYWSIATGAMAQTTSVAGFTESFAAGLLESAMQIADSGGPLLVVAYDVAGVGPMAEVTGCSLPFGCAFVLDAAGDDGSPTLRLATGIGHETASHPDNAGLMSLCAGNPIAAGTGALLQALAEATPRRIVLPLSSGLHLVLQLNA